MFEIDHKWFSRTENEYGWDVYPLGNKYFSGRLYNGIGGIIWLLSKLNENGYNVDPAKTNIQEGFKFIQSEISANLNNISHSFYFGKAGYAVIFSEGIRSGFVSDTQEIRQTIYECLMHPATNFDLIYGMAGQGLALIQCKDYLKQSDFLPLLNKFSNSIIEGQQKDGSWVKANTLNNKREKISGFGYGIAGITYFLFECGQQFNNSESIAAAEKGLQFLLRGIKRKANHYEWATSNHNKAIGTWWCNGAPGIALTFLKAFEITQNCFYKEIAEKALNINPINLVSPTLTQCHGLSGLGEIYLEAYKITKNTKWWEAATWIANLVINFKKNPSPETVCWLDERNSFATADLMTGNSGIIHFLTRYSSPGQISFPLLPTTKTITL